MPQYEASHHESSPESPEYCRREQPVSDKKRVAFAEHHGAERQLYPQHQSSPGSPGSYESEEDESEMSFGENIDRKIEKIKQNIRDDTMDKNDSITKLNDVL